MAIEKLNENVEIIQTLSDYPNTDQGLTPAELKRKFDEGSRIIKDYLNEVLVPAINDPHPTGLPMDFKPITSVSSVNYSKGDQDTDITVHPGFSLEEGRYLEHRGLDNEPIILRGTAAGVRDTDAVNVKQLKSAIKPLTVSIGVDSGASSHTPSQILAARAANRNVFGYLQGVDIEETQLSLLSVTAQQAVFIRFYDDRSLDKYLIDNGGAVEYYNECYATEDQVRRLEKTVAPLIVTLDNESERANHTSDEIQAHLEAGGDVYLAIDSCLVLLSWIDANNVAFFERYVPADKLKMYYVVWDDGTVEKISNRIATVEDLNAASDAITSAIDKLCPSFRESSAIVTCQPVEGYPLTVTAEEGATTITRCGKNLLNGDWRKYESYTKNLLTLQLPDGNYVLSAETSAPTFLYLDRYTKDGTLIKRHYIFTDTSTSLTKSQEFTVDSTKDEVWKIRGSTQINLDKIDWMQIETGSQFTSYELYRGETFAVGETIPALQGVNNIFADVGEVTVTGKADPAAIIADLSSKVAQLSETVATLLEG